MTRTLKHSLEDLDRWLKYLKNKKQKKKTKKHLLVASSFNTGRCDYPDNGPI